MDASQVEVLDARPGAGCQRLRRGVLALDDVCFLAAFLIFVLQGKLPVIPFDLEYILLLGLRFFRLACVGGGGRALARRHPRAKVAGATLGMFAASFLAYLPKQHLDAPQVLFAWSLLSCVAATPFLLGVDPERTGPVAPPESDASRAALKKLTLRSADFPVDTQGTCLICLADFSANGERWLQLRCEHLYHEECMRSWLASGGPGCPLRCTIDDDDEFELI